MTETRAQDVRALDAALVGYGAVLALVTVLLVVVPWLPFLLVAPGLDLVINTVAAVAATAVAGLAYTRLHEQGGVVYAFQAAAFGTLAAIGILFLAATLTGADGRIGLASTSPEQAPLYAWTVARISAAALLLAGAALELRGISVSPRAGRRLVVVSLAAITAAVAVVFSLAPVLPPLVAAVGDAPVDRARASLLATTGVGLVVQLVGAGLFLAAAVAFRRLFRRSAARLSGFLVIGMIVATFSQLHAALHPGVYTTLVTTGDLLRLVFYFALVLGIVQDTRVDLRELRRANGELARMREADIVRAAVDERGRLAREIHDGLIQDLWYAKLKQARVADGTELGAETRTTAREVLTAIDAALADARQTVMALRDDPAGSRVESTLRAAFEDFLDRFALRGSFEAAEPLPMLSPRAHAELLRMAQEALANVHKHADATFVRLEVTADGPTVRVAVIDNGCGFDPAAVPANRYGLRGIHERASLIGGRAEIRSAPSSGTTVVLEIPSGARA